MSTASCRPRRCTSFSRCHAVKSGYFPIRLMRSALGIDDLRFHDLRHEGISRLFEMGKTIPQAAAVSGHRSWTSLKRYTHIRQTGDKYKGWKWLPILEPLFSP